MPSYVNHRRAGWLGTMVDTWATVARAISPVTCTSRVRRLGGVLDHPGRGRWSSKTRFIALGASHRSVIIEKGLSWRQRDDHRQHPIHLRHGQRGDHHHRPVPARSVSSCTRPKNTGPGNPGGSPLIVGTRTASPDRKHLNRVLP